MQHGKTRAMIAERADGLFYAQGIDATSLADLADETGLSRGNFYHHFKTKDAIIEAVIEHRIAKTRTMLDSWATLSDDPAGRIRQFIDMMLTNRQPIMADGCPVGTFCTELAKADHPLLQRAAGVFVLFRDWLAAEFARLGQPAPHDLALHLLVRSQGIATLAAAFRDEALLQREVAMLHDWLADLCPHARI